MKRLVLIVFVSVFLFSGTSHAAYTFYMDSFAVVKNGNTIFLDEFNDGNPPPSSPGTIPYGVIGTLGPESGGKLELNRQNAALVTGTLGTGIYMNGALLATNTQPLSVSQDGLKIDDTFSVFGLFDLIIPTDPGTGYGIQLHDNVSYPPSYNDLVQVVVWKSATNEVSITFVSEDNINHTSTIIDSATLDALPHGQIAFMLSRDNLGTNLITASYAYVDDVFGGDWESLPWTSFVNKVDIFHGEDFTQAIFLAVEMARVPIPSIMLLLGSGYSGGFRLPTESEWETERASWSSNGSAGAFASPLKLVAAGYRDFVADGPVILTGSYGSYWTSTVAVDGDISISRSFAFDNDSALMYESSRAFGSSVRCIQD